MDERDILLAERHPDRVTMVAKPKRRRVLVVEDDYMIVAALVEALESRGAEVVGPVGTVDSALRLVRETARIDGALLDVNLRGTTAFAIADALQARGVPFVFATGYDPAIIPDRHAAVACCAKPVQVKTLLDVLLA